MTKEITMDVISNVGTFSESNSGWKKMLKLISWNGAEPKYDIRSWNPDETRSGKGVTLTHMELKALGEIIQKEIAELEF